jgi:iron complex outermembrane receptor protein
MSNHSSYSLSLSWLAICLAAPAASADEVETAPIVVHAGPAERAPGAARSLEESSFVTTVELGGKEAEGLSAAEVLAESVGVSVRSLGGLGGFASVSIRGASAGQTEIYVDGVPLSRLGTAAIDIGSLDLGTFDAVEIYRGGVPAQIGGGGLGGAVVLATRAPGVAEAGTTRVSVAGGSAWRGRLSRADWLSQTLWSRLAVGYVGAPGDFEYHDDGGTPINPDDDETRRRVNNAFHQVDAAWRVGRKGGAPWVLGLRFAGKRQGVPGQTGQASPDAELGTLRLLADGEHSRALGERAGVGVRGWFLGETQRWQNPSGDVGLRSDDTRYGTFAGGLTGWGTLLVGEAQLFRLGLDTRVERFTQTELDEEGGDAGGTRFGAALSLTDEIVLLGGDRLALSPTLRLETLTTRGVGEMRLGEGAPGSRDDVFLSPRLGVRFRATDALALKANLGRYFRPPTVVEIFGDRGFLVGNTTLRPEDGWTGDVGVVIAPRGAVGPLAQVYLETSGFLTRATDLIVLLPTSGRRSRAGNVGAATLFGGELAAQARLALGLSVTASYTLVLSRQDSPLVSSDGKSIPGRPRHEIGLRLDGERRLTRVRVGAWVDLALVSGNYLDEGNLEEVPPRRLVGAGVRAVLDERIALSLDVKNLFDARVHEVPLPGGGHVDRALADVLGYPLPGRSFLVTVELVL